MFVGEGWLNVFEASRVTNLPRVASDHGPVLMRCKIANLAPRGSSFRFQNMWVRHQGFMELVRNSWIQPTEATGLLCLQNKLARVKKTLQQWNKEVFGNLHANLKVAEERICVGQGAYESDPSPTHRANINRAIAEYILLLKMEEDFWRQKATLRWLAEGDRNTKFYQSWVRQKRTRLYIHGVEDGERFITEESELRGSAVEFFQNLLAPSPLPLAEPNLDIIQQLLPSSGLEDLIAPPKEEEVRKAVFDISGDSAPGPDGFTATFFQKCWAVVGSDVTRAVAQVFCGAFLPRSFTATSIVLIPKKETPRAWADYRPISLCNVTNKIITKVLVSRLTPLLPKVISPNQSGFVKGRLLHDNVLLAQEMFHELPRCSPAPNVALKLDMAKAYDRVQWPFLLKILGRMGFPEACIGLIERCISRCWFSVIINGSPAGFFASTRGLRQGDPISPALFVIAAEYLSRALDKLILGKKEMIFKTTLHCSTISHLAYADDILIFTQASSRAIRRLKCCLNEYEMVSGQQISLPKSNFYIAEMHEDWAESIQARGGYSRGTFPFLYLGVPIYRGAKRSDMFLFLREKIARRINGWAHRHLSFGGRLTLIKSTLEAIPIHTFQAIEPTGGVITQLDQQLARFFWGATRERKSMHWISWGQICLPVAEGGLGVRSLKEVLRAFSIKLWWRFRQQNSLWAKHMYSKYCRKASPLSLQASGRCSPTWRRLMRSWTTAHPHIRWVLGQGNVLFWDDIWLGTRPLRESCLDDRGNPQTLVADYWQDGHWNIPKLQTLSAQVGFPHQLIEEIAAIPIVHDEPDTPRWNLSKSGDFTLSSAWETIQSQRPIIPALEAIWHNCITNSMSIFMWRLLSNRVPVDTKLQWRNIALASKCYCCPLHPGIESLQHLFVNGSGASSVWSAFDPWFPGTTHPLRPEDSAPDRLDVWARRIQQPGKTHLCKIIPCLIMWFLWAERNRCRHNEGNFRAQNVVWQIQAHVLKLMSNGNLPPVQRRGTVIPMLTSAQAETRQAVLMAAPAKWDPPDPPWLKLNTATMFSGESGMATGGGVIRDHGGQLLLAFSVPFLASSALEASAHTARVGFVEAMGLGGHIWVESDDPQLARIVNDKCFGPAQARLEMARLRLVQRGCVSRFSSVCGQKNKAAAYLTKLRSDSLDLSRFDGNTAPSPLKKIVRLEQLAESGREEEHLG